MHRLIVSAAVTLSALSIAASAQNAPPSSFGQKPELPKPQESLLPTIKWASI